MGTAFSVTVSGRRAPDGARIRAEIERTLERIEGLMSAYRSDSEIGRFNLAAGSDWMPVSPVTARVVREAIEMSGQNEAEETQQEQPMQAETESAVGEE